DSIHRRGAEGRSQKSEVRGQRAEVRRQRSAVGGQGPVFFCFPAVVNYKNPGPDLICNVPWPYIFRATKIAVIATYYTCRTLRAVGYEPEARAGLTQILRFLAM
ncbi:MAG: hypothetical protein V3W43_05140, partial [Desulfatiglandaceae bacterium]